MEISEKVQEYFQSTIYNFSTKTSEIYFTKVNSSGFGKQG